MIFFLIDGSINEDLMYLGLISIAFIIRAMLVKKGVGESYIYDNE